MKTKVSLFNNDIVDKPEFKGNNNSSSLKKTYFSKKIALNTRNFFMPSFPCNSDYTVFRKRFFRKNSRICVIFRENEKAKAL